MKRQTASSPLLLLSLLAIGGCDSFRDDNRVVGQLESDRIELSAEFAPIGGPDEHAADDGDRAKLLFSIMEATYKCICARGGRYVDLQEMEVLLNRSDSSFWGAITQPHGSVAALKAGE